MDYFSFFVPYIQHTRSFISGAQMIIDSFLSVVFIFA